MANSALITIGNAVEVTVTVAFAVLSMIAMGMAVQGYCFRNLDGITRLLFLAASLGMVTPWLQWNIVGLVVGLAPDRVGVDAGAGAGGGRRRTGGPLIVKSVRHAIQASRIRPLGRAPRSLT